MFSINGVQYNMISLLGKGKGGYSYLVERDGQRYVLKQIHHEPCDYYTFGNKLESELRDYETLSRVGIRMPKMLAVDRENERISLGYKQLQPKPWDNAVEKYAVDSIVKGTVVRITAFGAFVALEPGIDGLIHISEVSNKFVQKVDEAVKVGQEIEALVLNVNPDEKRISLSIKALMAEEEVEEEVTEEASDEE